MDKALITIDPTTLALLHGAFGRDGAILPFAREILLVECPIAGTSHRCLRDHEPRVNVGDRMVLRREPGNPHDPLAIMVLSEAGAHWGYVPRASNEVLARLLDAGKSLFARLESKTWHDTWLEAEIRVFLSDQ